MPDSGNDIIGRKVRNTVKVKTFEEMLADTQRLGRGEAKTKESMEWFNGYASKFKGALTSSLMKVEKDNLTTQIVVGRMYVFLYDPKHKDTLPYYDRSPCIFPIEKYSDGSFLGINLHYLPPILRAKLLDALFSLENKAKTPENKKLLISYQILKSATKMRFFKPCVKKYLFKHVRSRFLEVPYDNWGQVPFLPISQFEGASVVEIWADSRKIYS